MKRCPKCDATFDADALWCPVDGAQLEDALHTLTEDAGHTLRDLPVPQAPGALTMGWEIPEVPQTLPGTALPGPPPPGALTLGWEIPEISDAPPRTTPTKLAAMASPLVPTTLAGVPTPAPVRTERPKRETSQLKAASLPPAAPRMTPQTLAAALARAPAPARSEPSSTPTSIDVPPSIATPTSIDVPLLPVAEPMVAPAPIPDEPAITQPFGATRTAPMAAIAEPLGPPPNLLAQPPHPASPSQPPAPRRLITEPMRVVLAEPAPVIEVMPPSPPEPPVTPPPIEMTAPVAQVSVELRAPITMPGVVAPPIRTSLERLPLRRPPAPSDAPPMGEAIAVASQLAPPSQIQPAAPRSNRWMWIAIAVIAIAGVVGTLLALQ